MNKQNGDEWVVWCHQSTAAGARPVSRDKFGVYFKPLEGEDPLGNDFISYTREVTTLVHRVRILSEGLQGGSPCVQIVGPEGLLADMNHELYATKQRLSRFDALEMKATSNIGTVAWASASCIPQTKADRDLLEGIYQLSKMAQRTALATLEYLYLMHALILEVDHIDWHNTGLEAKKEAKGAEDKWTKLARLVGVDSTAPVKHIERMEDVSTQDP